MSTNRGLAELVRQAGIPISRAPQRLREVPVRLDKQRLLELEALLHLRDGFRTLGGALILRPSVTVASFRGIEEWNQLSLWRTPYRKATELLFFAEDILGRQFALYRDEVVHFDPETGKVEHHAFTLERWAERVLDEPDSVGRPILERWLSDHPPLQATQRLQPNVPLHLSQDDDPGFTVVDDLELMKRYARLYRELQSTEQEPPDLSWWLESSTA